MRQSKFCIDRTRSGRGADFVNPALMTPQLAPAVHLSIRGKSIMVQRRDGPVPVPKVPPPIGDRAMGAQYNRRQPIFQALDCYALPNGIATNLVAPPDFMRSSTVCLPSTI